jgi:hypothetical protein
MQTDTDKLEYLSRLLTTWDQDLRLGHRGVDQLTMFLQEAVAQSRAGQRGRDGEPGSSPRYSLDDLEYAFYPDTLATLRMLATGYLLHIPGLLAAIEDCEAMLTGRGRSRFSCH